MRIRRSIVAPLIITAGAVGSLVAVPVMAAVTAATPAAAAVAIGTVNPDIIIVHA